MALSTAARRAIAIRKNIAKRANTVTTQVAANDNQVSARVRGGSRMMSSACLQACIDAGGFDQNARFA